MKPRDKYQQELWAKFKAGTIDPSERHALEKMALDDPFLFDALEGYSQLKHPYDHREQAILKRIKSSKKLGIPSRLAIAAGILILIATSIWISGQLGNTNQDVLSEKLDTSNNPQEIQNEPQSQSDQNLDTDTNDVLKQKKVTPTTNRPEQAADRAEESVQPPVKSNKTLQQNESEPNDPVKPETKTEDHVIAKDENLATQSEESEIADQPSKMQARKLSTQSSEQLQKAKPSAAPTPKVSDPEMLSGSTMLAENSFEIHGRIVDNAGNPATGAFIVVNDGERGTMSDENGYYRLSIFSDDGQFFTISYPGFQIMDIPLEKPNTTEFNIKLAPADELNYEIVVADDAFTRGAKDATPLLEPKLGVAQFRKYVSLAVSTSDCVESGSVQLTFEVDPNGETGRFEIKRSLTRACDKIAIDIIKNGGSWTNEFAKTKRIRYTIKFE